MKVAAMGRPVGATSHTATWGAAGQGVPRCAITYLDIVRNPLNKVGRVLVLHSKHLRKKKMRSRI